ncbi:ribosome small subunit-dependent GTPase A [Anaerosacchariphilus polymeriproducens]|uniref:Small ribosomal subunit biogenesis GTPase RsgA n=1 Tax=Anaerosacchariphilus polymeriproducens TaxID=1812858 RepID=A0A371AXL7_9FIRM|nr:ribosome small subunit-dependent GTPase A [Anaerosacchariphilus polymeriproducens]RDU24318.1 ribosome small subunit-dependent GTPase A [Anaerosacchariphilus polymeriproducens]
MQGKIVKGIAGFYYVHVLGYGIYECKAKGIFRKENIKPLVGDNVEIDVIDSDEKKGNINKILPRLNELIRPAVSNIDQALIIFAVAKPRPHFNLLDRFLIMMQKQKVPTIICFNKTDLADDEEINSIQKIYKDCGYQVLLTSAALQKGMEELRMILKDKTTAVAGPSGVGKSSIINILQSNIEMETAEISTKIERGKHTTRHTQLIHIDGKTYIMDTPGFSSLLVEDFQKEELKDYFPELNEYEGLCRFQGCSHTHEPGCKVKEALEQGKISKLRYDNYIELYNELKDKRRY